MSGSNKLDASTIGNCCANCIVLHSCAKASNLHAMNSASQSGKVYKGGDQIKGRHKLIVAAIFEVDCCVDVGAGTQAIISEATSCGRMQSSLQEGHRIFSPCFSNDLTFVTYQYNKSPFIILFSAIFFCFYLCQCHYQTFHCLFF